MRRPLKQLASELIHKRPVQYGGAALVALLLAVWAIVQVHGCTPSNRLPANPPGQGRTPSNLRPATPPQEPIMRVQLSKVSGSAASIAIDGPVSILGDSDRPVAQLPNLPDCSLTVSSGPVWQLGGYRVPARRLVLRLPPHEIFRINKQAYRGDLCLYLDGPNELLAVNELGMEDYVAGVVTAESPASYPLTALQAQAVIARTYSMCEKLYHGDRAFDVTDTTSSQVYGGLAYDKGPGRQATDATRGLMLVYGPPGQEKVFWTFFSSTCGGGSMSVRYFRPKLQPEIPPLAGGVPCPWCRDSKWYNWENVDAKYRVVSVPHAEVWARLRKANPQLPVDGRDVRIVADERDQFGRILTVKLECAEWRRPIVMLGDELRLAVGADRIHSMLVEMTDTGSALVFRNGHGNGHGVGLCQVGAAAMARAGNSTEVILGHYYPQASIKRAY